MLSNQYIRKIAHAKEINIFDNINPRTYLPRLCLIKQGQIVTQIVHFFSPGMTGVYIVQVDHHPPPLF